MKYFVKTAKTALIRAARSGKISAEVAGEVKEVVIRTMGDTYVGKQ